MKNVKHSWILGILLWALSGQAQSNYYPRDTTYTIQSAYEKARQKYPDIEAVWPKLPRSVASHENVVYLELENGRQLHLDVYHPKRKGKKKRPAVLMIHGGGWMAGSKENMRPMAQQLAQKGYVAVVAEYRLGGEAPYPAGVQDLKTAVRWMRANAENYGIDSGKIAAYGCSAGAHLASLLGATNKLTLYDYHETYNGYSAEVQAVLNIDGIVSFIHPEAEPEWTGRSANAWLGDYQKNYPRWKEASPLTYADENLPPFLFVNSSFPRFHAGREDLRALLQENGTYYEAQTFAGSPHGFWLFKPWFKPTLTYSVGFLREVFE